MTNRLQPSILDTKYSTKKRKLTPWKHGMFPHGMFPPQTHSPEEIHSTHRQDIGKLS